MLPCMKEHFNAKAINITDLEGSASTESAPDHGDQVQQAVKAYDPANHASGQSTSMTRTAKPHDLLNWLAI